MSDTMTYSIEYSSADSAMLLAWWLDEAERDAVWDQIQAIPWLEIPGYIGYSDWQERTVEFKHPGDPRCITVTDHPEAHSVHGCIHRHARPLAQVATVRDVTDRTPRHPDDII